jgi:hypothetical protein
MDVNMGLQWLIHNFVCLVDEKNSYRNDDDAYERY